MARSVLSGNRAMNPGDAAQPAPAPRGPGPQAGILVLCTANVCRSAMGAPLLARRLARRGVTVPVRSAGMLGDDAPPDPAAVTVMAGYGIEIAAHHSHQA